MMIPQNLKLSQGYDHIDEIEQTDITIMWNYMSAMMEVVSI